MGRIPELDIGQYTSAIVGTPGVNEAPAAAANSAATAFAGVNQTITGIAQQNYTAEQTELRRQEAEVREQQKALETGVRQVKSNTLFLGIDDKVVDLKNNLQKQYVDQPEMVSSELQKQAPLLLKEALQDEPDPLVKNSVTNEVLTSLRGHNDGVKQWAVGQQLTNATAQLDNQRDILIKQVGNTTDLNDLKSSMDKLGVIAESSMWVKGDKMPDYVSEARQKMATAYLDNLMINDWHAVDATIKSGLFKDLLPSSERLKFENEYRGRVEAQAREAERNERMGMKTAAVGDRLGASSVVDDGALTVEQKTQQLIKVRDGAAARGDAETVTHVDSEIRRIRSEAKTEKKEMKTEQRMSNLEADKAARQAEQERVKLRQAKYDSPEGANARSKIFTEVKDAIKSRPANWGEQAFGAVTGHPAESYSDKLGKVYKRLEKAKNDGYITNPEFNQEAKVLFGRMQKLNKNFDPHSWDSTRGDALQRGHDAIHKGVAAPKAAHTAIYNDTHSEYGRTHDRFVQLYKREPSKSEANRMMDAVVNSSLLRHGVDPQYGRH